jgi:DNA-directed RNA polymerase subunit E'/Rpb7
MASSDIYEKGVITHLVSLTINEIGSNIKELLEEKIKNDLEGKCSKEGFVKPNSVEIISYSSGKIMNGSNITFEVVIEALFVFPVEGMLIDCVATNITKAGIKAELNNITQSPVIIFISRDHFNTDEYFLSIKENDSIKVRVIGQRFELNDTFISIIAELVKQRTQNKQPYIVLEE